MRNTVIIAFILFLLVGCGGQQLAKKDVVRAYYKAFDSGNYDELKAVLNDSITAVNGDFVTPYNQKSYYTFFKWDSIFNSSYTITELKEKGENIKVTVAQKNLRNKFLKNNPLIFKVKVSFVSGKISKLEDLEYTDVNWEVWNKEKNDLVLWIKNNYPELDGFVNDMTMKGAMNYLKAIELYEQSK